MTWFWYVILDDAWALANNTKGIFSRTSCQVCIASLILKFNSLVGIPRPWHLYDHITHLSLFTATGERMFREGFVHWWAVSTVFVQFSLLETSLKRSLLCQPIVLSQRPFSMQNLFRWRECMNGTFFSKASSRCFFFFFPGKCHPDWDCFLLC